VPSIRDLVTQARAGQSVPGLAVTSAALVIMPSLPIAKHRTDRPWATRSHRRRRRERLLRVHRGRRPAGRWPEYLAGWWLADPAAALVIAVLAAREGIEAWQDDD